MKCILGASRYSVIADPIAHMILKLSPGDDRNPKPPPAAVLTVDFELLDRAPNVGAIDVAPSQ